MKTVIDVVNECQGSTENIEKSGRLEKIIFESTVNNSFQSKGDLCTDNTNHTPDEWRTVCTIDEVNKCVEEMTNMNIKPVYTQTMVDAGVMPSVGMEFLVGNESDSRAIDFKGKVVKVIGLSKLDDDTVLTFSHPTMGIGCGVFFESWVKATAPTIELINGKAYRFKPHVVENPVEGFYSADQDEFVYLQGTVESRHASDVQLLGVKS